MSKKSLGQYFTKSNAWLKPHIIEFIKNTKATTAVDPFAGAGDLLKVIQPLQFKEYIGLDIDPNLNWKINDSLLNIPKFENSIIITNPPYLAKNSAKRLGLNEAYSYFTNSKCVDLYQIAIQRCMENNRCGVLLVPETFINDSIINKNRVSSITIIEDLCFEDTEVPICVVCFDDEIKKSDILIYKNDKLIGTLEYLNSFKKEVNNIIDMSFNSPKGQVALRAVDSTNPNIIIKFMKPQFLKYDLTKISESSRSITLIDLTLPESMLDDLILESNNILNDFRIITKDILLSPFKGNNKDGKRRRRLDYQTARAIIEEAYLKIRSKQC